MDKAIESVNSKGKYQIIISFIILSVTSISLILCINFAFLTKRPGFMCKLKNSTDIFQICPEENLCLPILYDYIKNPKISLNNFSYEFDFYCEKSFYIPLFGTAYFFGGILGTILLSPIPDKYGRAQIYKILIISLFILNINTLFAFSPIHLIITTVLIGIASYAYSMSSLIVTEYLDRNKAGIIMSANMAIYPIIGILTAIFFIYINSWKILFIIFNIIGLISVYYSQKYFLESPRWLNSKNRVKEAVEVLKQISIINGNEIEVEKYLELNKSKFYLF